MIVFDTHTWIWFVSNPELLSKRAEKATDTAMNAKEIFISSISAWEIALLVEKERLKLTMDVTDWVSQSGRLPFFRFIPVDNAIAIKAVNLPQPLHSDPADRIIIATATTIGAPLVTKDEKILKYPHVKSIW
ncbi:MAG: type II toxin-antitoxin system VapC family toxin [Deltaproteobacteria bacterium]|nr:type II toxin-antitoxin system VapC family toxin [Deltaproteobacteria bacterium]